MLVVLHFIFRNIQIKSNQILYVYLNDVDIALTFVVDNASWLDELRY